MKASWNGTGTFPQVRFRFQLVSAYALGFAMLQVIGNCIAAKCDTYYVDYLMRETRFYFADGSTHRVAFPSDVEHHDVGSEFKLDDIKNAIKAAQADTIR